LAPKKGNFEIEGRSKRNHWPLIKSKNAADNQSQKQLNKLGQAKPTGHPPIFSL